MSLTIDNATIGYDQNAMISTLQAIENNVVNDTKQQLRNATEDLRTAVNACWVGKSAETFKSNVDHDVEAICDGLDKAYDGLKAEFEKVLAGLSTIDEELVEERQEELNNGYRSNHW